MDGVWIDGGVFSWCCCTFRHLDEIVPRGLSVTTIDLLLLELGQILTEIFQNYYPEADVSEVRLCTRTEALAERCLS
jgi:hypothetical protein